jgi:hypothetical protein
MQIEANPVIAGARPEFTRFPVLKLFFDNLSSSGVDVDLYPRKAGMELHFLNMVNGLTNRAYLRIYFPTDSKCVLFFHKKSSIPFSRDRFSYGGVVIDSRSSSRFDDEDVREWIDFLTSGLQPKSRPKTLKKSFPYTIPED